MKKSIIGHKIIVHDIRLCKYKNHRYVKILDFKEATKKDLEEFIVKYNIKQSSVNNLDLSDIEDNEQLAYIKAKNSNTTIEFFCLKKYVDFI